MQDYDLAVIGSGPAGQKAAICGAKLGRRVAVIDRRHFVGGVCVNTGTIPSKTLREAVLNLSGYRERAMAGASHESRKHVTFADLMRRTNQVIRNEIDVIHNQLRRNDVDVYYGTASFTDPGGLEIVAEKSVARIRASTIVIAVGTRPATVPDVPVDQTRILDSDGILSIPRIPKTLCVIGGGVVGCEYASIFAALGTRVTLVEQRDQLLPFVDREIVDLLVHQLRQQRLTLRLGEAVDRVEHSPAGSSDGPVTTHLRSGKTIQTELVLQSAGRQGAVDTLQLEKAGLTADGRGRIPVDEQFRTPVPHIFAVGDVVGFPNLASTSMEQGRMAVCHAFSVPVQSVPELFPFAIYTIPELSMVGRTEEALTAQRTPYEVGEAQYREIARGQILGDESGLLKILFHRETHDLLGVHVIGEGAAELIHIGQAVLALGGKLDYFVRTVFNYPTLAECYKVAAFDGLNRARG